MPEFRFTIQDMPWAVPPCHPSMAFAPDGICASEDTDGPVTSQFAVIEGLEGGVWNLRPAASPQFATVTLIKQVVNDDSGTAVVSDFDLFLQDPAPDLFVTSSGTPVGADSILRYDGLSGIFQDVFHSARALGELSYLTTAPGGHLHVSGSDTFFDGAFDQHVVAEKLSVPTVSIDVPFLDPNFPLSPGVGQGIDLGPDGHFYLYDAQNDEVRRFDDLTGADLGVFVPSPNDVRDQEFGPNGNLFVLRSSEVMEYNGVNGLGIGIFTSGGLFANARGITFGSDSDLYISAEDFVTGTPTIYRYDGLTGVLDGIVATHPDFQGLGDLVFGSDGQLYVSDGDILESLEALSTRLILQVQWCHSSLFCAAPAVSAIPLGSPSVRAGSQRRVALPEKYIPGHTSLAKRIRSATR